jgi:hypothetical protein
LAFKSGSLPNGNFAELKNQSTKKPLIQGYVVTRKQNLITTAKSDFTQDFLG